MSRRPRVAILGGGMAGVAAAWELSRPGWRDRVESIDLYQRGWLLGGKGASTRGPEGRILEHGLHVWLGYYDNAFRILQECYAELDRPRTDPGCPVRTWRDAFVPAADVGVFEHRAGDVAVWLARFATNELVPGRPREGDADIGSLVRRGVALIADLLRSSRGQPGERVETAVDLLTTVLRGVTSDGLLTPGTGFGAVDHEDFRAWLARHGARPSTIEGGLVRGMYDLVFAYRDGDRGAPAFAAGLGVFLAVRMFLDFKGAIFWKMTAGMGDVVFAPLHQALTERGVAIRYFHRVDALHLDADATRLDEVRLTRQVPADVVARYEPLDRVDGLPCYPDRPLLGTSRLATLADPTEDRPVAGDGDPLTLVQGQDFDEAVLAIGLGALPSIAGELVHRLPRWRAMISHVQTVATRAAQVWLRPDEAALGWPAPGATVAGLEAPYDTCASMTHLLAAERWPAADRPAALAYLCSVLPAGATDPVSGTDAFLRTWGGALWPGLGPIGLDDAAVRAHHAQHNTDPSDRYVQALPGTDPHRLRVDQSGVAHLTLAGDWTDCGLNAGCIEAAAISGIQAAAVIEGRPLADHVLGPLTWDWA